jgi:hypothetical protein
VVQTATRHRAVERADDSSGRGGALRYGVRALFAGHGSHGLALEDVLQLPVGLQKRQAVNRPSTLRMFLEGFVY